MYLTTGIRAIGTLTIDKEKINVKKNFAPKSLCFQHEISVNLTDIEFIEFKYITHDTYPIWTMPFMNLYLSNEQLIKINVFPYSKREGTPAAIMKNQIDGNIKKQRVKELIEVSEELKNEYYEKFIGKSLEVLVETYSEGYLIGHLSNYGKVKFKGDESFLHNLVMVKLNDYINDEFMGELIKEEVQV